MVVFPKQLAVLEKVSGGRRSDQSRHGRDCLSDAWLKRRQAPPLRLRPQSLMPHRMKCFDVGTGSSSPNRAEVPLFQDGQS